jgi:hypothetical protein
MPELTPPCERCEFNIETAPVVWSTQPMLLVQPTLPVHENDPFGARMPAGGPTWVCGHCHAPFEEVLTVVKEGSGLPPKEPGLVRRARRQGLL